jgi:cyclophilin family peptidyl-prolyl cis-trans isomerase
LNIFDIHLKILENMSDTTLTKGEIHTSKGVLTFELYDDDAPIAVANFKKLINQGFYDGLSFHRVIPNFMIQGGCPDGTGAGGPGYTIACETKGVKQVHDRGVISMAHRGPNTGGSQFFICHNRSNTKHLDGVHTCFGKITNGLDLIDDIRGGDKMDKVILLN